MEVLEKALHVFWLRGYDATSLDDLTEIMGLDKDSIYAKFGTKSTLFERTIELYRAKYTGYVNEALTSPTPITAAKIYLEGAADFLTDKSHPNGCFFVKNANTFNQVIVSKKEQLVAKFKTRFDLAKLQGDLPANTDTQQLAQYIDTVHQGMSLQATSGASKEELLTTASMALNVINQLQSFSKSQNNSYA